LLHLHFKDAFMQRSLLIIILVLFGALSAVALWHHGYWGIFAPAFQSLAAGQVLADLGIALSLVMIWMWHDAKATGRNIWPWIVATLALGSFGPLLYLLTRKSAARSG
jgi:Terpene cyclase DEP1